MQSRSNLLITKTTHVEYVEKYINVSIVTYRLLFPTSAVHEHLLVQYSCSLIYIYIYIKKNTMASFLASLKFHFLQ